MDIKTPTDGVLLPAEYVIELQKINDSINIFKGSLSELDETNIENCENIRIIKNVFYSTAYMQALRALSENDEDTGGEIQLKFQADGNVIIDSQPGVKSQYKDVNAVTEYDPGNICATPYAPTVSVKEQAVIYYFITNPKKNPISQAVIYKTDIEKIQRAFRKLDKFYYEASEKNEKQIDIQQEFSKFLVKSKVSYRTKAKAQEAGATDELPQNNRLAISTNNNYLYNISFHDEGAAYLQQVKSSIPLKFENGSLFLDGISGSSFKAKLEDITTQENIEEIDLPILSVFYTIILHQFQASNYTELKETVKISVPDLAKYMGLPQNLNKERTQELIEKVKSYHNIIGVIPSTRTTRSKTPPLPDLSPVLLLVNYFEDTNIIEFSSPYMNRVINAIFEESIRRNKKGEIETKKDGRPLLEPSHTYLIKSSIVKSRDPLAVENVKIIVQGIEDGGDNLYHISVKTLLKRNPQLNKRLQDDPKHKGEILKRVFKTTWQLLRDETLLTETYKNIALPDPNNPADIPTVKDIKTKVFNIPHEGKKPGKKGKKD